MGVCVCKFISVDFKSMFNVYITNMVLMNMHRVDCFVYRMFTFEALHVQQIICEFEYVMAFTELERTF